MREPEDAFTPSLIQLIHRRSHYLASLAVKDLCMILRVLCGKRIFYKGEPNGATTIQSQQSGLVRGKTPECISRKPVTAHSSR